MMQKKPTFRTIFSILVILTLFFIAGCSGGGSDSAGNPDSLETTKASQYSPEKGSAVRNRSCVYLKLAHLCNFEGHLKPQL